MALVPIADKAKLEALPLPDESSTICCSSTCADAHRREEAGLMMRKMHRYRAIS